ncbi:hypothetical protein EJB05_28831 [Eragrostis curvula]|uniref:NB-ARC domain-containing protein n=1 Tax=Eragrostis curvula TaxID=38414 RepID=A0A5J9UR65_9POAL|nr:hypothetical protein EJB05_28831 [Eragrostis curvula]
MHTDQDLVNTTAVATVPTFLTVARQENPSKMNGMEASLASALLKIAGDKLISLITSEFAAISGVKKNLSELQDIHGEITSWLSVVRDLSVENDPRFCWVIKLKDVAYDIDDLLYEVHLEAEKHKIDRDVDKDAICHWFYAKSKSYLFRWKVAQMIKAIKASLATIAKQRIEMNAIGHNLPMNDLILSRNRATTELTLLTNVEESQIPTRDQEKESNEGEDDWIVSVVGLGGSGKTTLAKHICSDTTIKEHFKDKIFWVHISQEYDVKKLIAKLFEAITKQKSDFHAPQHMVDEISRKLTSEKFLLVLDDAWHEDKDDWKEFMVLLKSHAPGSKLMLTTRDHKVAEAVKSRHIFELAFLSVAESWSLFLKSSGRMEEDLSPEFIHVGKEIVNKCSGVPLAIKTIGGILSEKREISTWRALKQSNLWNEENTERKVFASLKLSYIHLKDHLKQCFTFCCIFPKGCRINKNYLIEQWIAHGFIKQVMDEQPEITGREYFNSLVKVGFFQDPLESWDGNGVVYKMHDLIHDLTRYILQSDLETSLPTNMTKDSTQKCRYLSLASCSENDERVFFDKVRALYVFEGNPSLDKLVKKSRYICSVVLHCAIRTPFPLFIVKLHYLVYLEIHNVSCTELPEAISGCWNLQSLHFIGSSGFETLPKSIGKLKKLRALELIRSGIESLPQSIGDCRDLQALQIINCTKFREIPNTIGENESLRVLQIVKCTSLKLMPSEFIGEFSNIQTINLAGCSSLQDLQSTFASRTLCTLSLSQTRVTKLPEWVTLMDTLECINLEECHNLVELPRGMGNLKRLEFLNLNGCWKLCWMPSGFAQLTRLKRLDLYVVGCGGDGARISDLGNLDMISGSLEIKNLQHVIDSSDAEKACLKQKKNIKNLKLSRSACLIEEEFVFDLGVLDALEPPSDIENLCIFGYRGADLPCWISKQCDSSYLAGEVLKQTNQPPFLCLIELELTAMDNLKHMRAILVLRSLKNLWLISMPKLEELWTTTSGLGISEEEDVGKQYCFPVLSHLQIKDCPKLIVEPYFPPSLESLTLTDCNEQLVSFCSSFFRLLLPCVDEPSSSSRVVAVVPHLKRLELGGLMGTANDLGFLQHLSRLQSLKFSDQDLIGNSCSTSLDWSVTEENFVSDLGVLDALEPRSEIEELHSDDGYLEGAVLNQTSQQPKSMRGLTSLPQSVEHLKSLTSLSISWWDTLKQLPETIQHLTSLQELNLVGCSALTVLPECLGQLSALQSLTIHYCPALQSLPSSIQRLTALQHLSVSGCPDLARRCKKEAGDDWHLISHIPYVSIY